MINELTIRRIMLIAEFAQIDRYGTFKIDKSEDVPLDILCFTDNSHKFYIPHIIKVGEIVDNSAIKYNDPKLGEILIAFSAMKKIDLAFEFSNTEENNYAPADEEEITSILNDSLEAWKIMMDMWTRLRALHAKYPNSVQLEHAIKHAYNAPNQEINGMRDHIKLSAGRI